MLNSPDDFPHPDIVALLPPLPRTEATGLTVPGTPCPLQDRSCPCQQFRASSQCSTGRVGAAGDFPRCGEVDVVSKQTAGWSRHAGDGESPLSCSCKKRQ